MERKVEKRGDAVYSIELKFEPEEVKKEVEAVAREIGKRAKVPGFRPGKAPVHIIKKYYPEEIKNGLVRSLVAGKVAEVVKEENLNILTEPVIEELDFNPDKNELRVVLLVEVKPEVPLKKEDYTGIKVKKKVKEIGEEDVEKVIEGLRNQLANWKEVDREAKEGDLVEIEYETEIEGEEKPNAGSVAVVLGQNQLWPEVEKEVVGKKAGEEGEVEFTAGDNKEVYGEAAGKKVKVKFKVKAVKEKELPEVNDEFAKKLGFESVEEMKKRIRDDLEIAEKTREQEEVEDQIIDQLLSKVEIPVPPSLLDLEVRAQAENQLRRLAQTGVDVRQISPQAIIEMVRPIAEKTVKVKLLLEKVAELEGIEVSDEELDKEIEKLANELFNGDYVQARKSLEERNLLPMIKEDLRRQKALDKLIELAEIEEVKEEEKEEG
ncbi:trigger factor [Thermovibrio sp.]